MKKENDDKNKLGTFAGVFTPSILTILGIILFRRMGYIIGSSGLGYALVMLGVGTVISVLTSLSLAALATNIKVKGGGDYYLISRTLGKEFGGAIGLVLYFAQAVSIAFYCLGFGEAVSAIIPVTFKAMPQLIAVLAVIGLFYFAWKGADIATKFQYVVMFLLFAALVSFYTGAIPKFNYHLLGQNWSKPAGTFNFWLIFAIYFPAVTGFTQGVSMSGDLKNPAKSLPLGTFFAVGLSTIIYISVSILFAGTIKNDVLINNYSSMQTVSSVDFLITAGVIAATLSSAMASFLGAPRILQSLAKDKLFPFLNFFGKGFGPMDNPRRGVLLSLIIALVIIAMGNLNLVASIVTMFFLISYGLLNYATYSEARSASPSFRPTFKFFDKRFALLGAVGCMAAMIAIDVLLGILAMIVLFGIYKYISKQPGLERWADSKRAYLFQSIRDNIFALSQEPEHLHDWRPQIIVFSNNSSRRKRLIKFSLWIEGNAGITTVARILEGSLNEMEEMQKEKSAEIINDISQLNAKVFSRVIIAPSFIEGTQVLLQSSGIGPIKSNTILLNWLDNAEKFADPVEMKILGKFLKTGIQLGNNVIVLDFREEDLETINNIPKKERSIHIWWQDDATSKLMLLLAYLMTRSDEWENCSIKVIGFSTKPENGIDIDQLNEKIQEVRIPAQCSVKDNASSKTIIEESSSASMVFLPLKIKYYTPLDPFGGSLSELLNKLPVVSMVLAAEDIPIDLEPEEGKITEQARAVDDVLEAKDALKEAENLAGQAIKEVKKIIVKAKKLDDPDELEKKGAEISQAIKDAKKATKMVDKGKEVLEKKSKKIEEIKIES